MPQTPCKTPRPDMPLAPASGTTGKAPAPTPSCPLRCPRTTTLWSSPSTPVPIAAIPPHAPPNRTDPPPESAIHPSALPPVESPAAPTGRAGAVRSRLAHIAATGTPPASASPKTPVSRISSPVPACPSNHAAPTQSLPQRCSPGPAAYKMPGPIPQPRPDATAPAKARLGPRRRPPPPSPPLTI